MGLSWREAEKVSEGYVLGRAREGDGSVLGRDRGVMGMS